MHQSDLFPADRTRYLPIAKEGKALGPFPHAYDFYGDGSLYIVDSPGHLDGHANILARTSADGGWIYLAGDSVHHWNIIKGESEIKIGAPWDKNFCMHHNREVAVATIDKIKELWKIPRVRIVLAHDGPFYQEHKGAAAFWPGTIESL